MAALVGTAQSANGATISYKCLRKTALQLLDPSGVPTPEGMFSSIKGDWFQIDVPDNRMSGVATITHFFSEPLSSPDIQQLTIVQPIESAKRGVSPTVGVVAFAAIESGVYPGNIVHSGAVSVLWVIEKPTFKDDPKTIISFFYIWGTIVFTGNCYLYG